MELLKQKKLAELTDFISRGISPKYVDDEGYIVLNQKCIRDNKIDFSNSRQFNKYQKVPKNKFVKIGDILINSTGVGTLGRTALVRELPIVPVTVDGHITIVRPKKEISPEYLGLFLNCNEPYIENLAGGATGQTELSKTDVTRIPVFIPKSTSQKKIAAILTAYDDLIELNNRSIKILKKMTEEIYREWFVRMRFPGYEKVKFIKGIPVSFSTDKANLYLDYVKGRSYSSEEISDFEGELPFINLKSFLRGGGYRHDGIKYYSGKYSEEQLVYPRDIVLAVTDMTQNREIVGRVARIPQFFFEKAVISLDAIKIIPLDVSKTFLYSFLLHSGFGLLLKEFANGSNVLHLSPSVIKKQIMLLPPKHLQEKFDEIANPLYEKIDYLTYSNNLLKKSKELLLPRLLSGKLSVENLDIKFPPSMEEINA